MTKSDSSSGSSQAPTSRILQSNLLGNGDGGTIFAHFGFNGIDADTELGKELIKLAIGGAQDRMTTDRRIYPITVDYDAKFDRPRFGWDKDMNKYYPPQKAGKEKRLARVIPVPAGIPWTDDGFKLFFASEGCEMADAYALLALTRAYGLPYFAKYMPLLAPGQEWVDPGTGSRFRPYLAKEYWMKYAGRCPRRINHTSMSSLFQPGWQGSFLGLENPELKAGASEAAKAFQKYYYAHLS